MSELKPCPFCGGEAKIYTSTRERPGWCDAMRAVKCKSCWCETEEFDTRGYNWEKMNPFPLDADSAATAAWNSRSPQWQPIETAPKDGTVIILLDGGLVFSGIYQTWNWRTTDISPNPRWEDIDGAEVNPSHWMPLPAQPEMEVKG